MLAWLCGKRDMRCGRVLDPHAPGGKRQRIPAAAIYTKFVMAELREAGAARGLEPFDDPRQWARAFDADAHKVFGVALCRPAHVARGPLDTLPPPATAVRVLFSGESLQHCTVASRPRR